MVIREYRGHMVAIGEVSQHARVLNVVVGTLQCRSLEGYDGEKIVWHIWFLAPESSNGNPGVITGVWL